MKIWARKYKKASFTESRVLFNKQYHYKLPSKIIPIYDFLCRFVSVLFPKSSRHDKLVKLLYHERFDLNIVFIIYIITAYSQKQQFLKHSHITETIILGTSHGLFGYDSRSIKESNFSFPSLDLYYIYNLFTVNYTLCQNLKRIILFFSPFNSGYCVQHSSTADFVSPIMQHIWGININSIGKVTAIAVSNLHKIKEFIQYKNTKLILTQDEYWALYKNYIFTPPQQAQLEHSNQNHEIYKKHISIQNSNACKQEELHYLYKLISLTKDLNLNIYIVIPPFTQRYLSGFSDECFFRKLPYLFKNHDHVQVLDYSINQEFNDHDFMDPDHLNPIGTQKLTLKIHNAISQTEGISYP